MKKNPTGVLLLNMGGPQQLKDVRPFLYNLFSDREIIKLGPRLLQKPLAWWIAKKRAPKSAATYQQIGGGSPLNTITGEQADALASELSSSGDYLVEYAMRYWQPYCDEVLAKMVAAGVDKVIALPLYPHYSRATSGSSLRQLRQQITKNYPEIEYKEILSWPEQPEYIEALCTNIKQGMAQFPGKVEIVYSAHSLPVSFIEDGDPYLDQTRQTIAAIEKITGIKGHLCFQSRSGPVEWLGPSTPDMLKSLQQQGCKQILMVPISFVSDHIETLYEMDILYRQEAKKLGIALLSAPSLNCNQQFIKGLAQLVLSR